METRFGDFDCLGAIDGGRAYEDLLDSSVLIDFENRPVRLLTLREVLAVKRRAGRPKDLAAIPYIESTIDEIETEHAEERAVRSQPTGPSLPDDPDATERALVGSVKQLLADYPWADPAHVEAVLRSNFATTRDAKVPNYRLLLAERDTRVRLRRESPRP